MTKLPLFSSATRACGRFIVGAIEDGDHWWVTNGFALYKTRPPTAKQLDRAREKIAKMRAPHVTLEMLQRTLDRAGAAALPTKVGADTREFGHLTGRVLVTDGVDPADWTWVQDRYLAPIPDGAAFFVCESPREPVAVRLDGTLVAAIMPLVTGPEAVT